jgi:hypothetical protein
VYVSIPSAILSPQAQQVCINCCCCCGSCKISCFDDAANTCNELNDNTKVTDINNNTIIVSNVTKNHDILRGNKTIPFNNLSVITLH